MTDILADIFSSATLVKMMRLFLMNAEDVFDSKDIGRRIKTNVSKVNYEINLLKKVGFIKPGVREIEIVFKTKKPKRKKIKGWTLNPDFALMHQFRSLILDSAPIGRDVLLKKFNTLGTRVKMVLLSGVFLDESQSRVDVVVVGDNVNRNKLESVLGGIESEIGKELRYALFSTEEFLYRMSMFDHFLREIFDQPHEKLLNKLNI